MTTPIPITRTIANSYSKLPLDMPIYNSYGNTMLHIVAVITTNGCSGCQSEKEPATVDSSKVRFLSTSANIRLH
jgi:hypothetical protein